MNPLDALIAIAWDELRLARAPGWLLGQPIWYPHLLRWGQVALWKGEARSDPLLPRAWVAVGDTEVDCLREMTRGMRELAQGRWPR
ncbi:MAG: hypothetical protein U0869_22850 [Chloroflexota bacterium]